MFIELPNGIIVNADKITRLKDITGTGYYRVFLEGGVTIDLNPEDSEALKAQLLPVAPPVAVEEKPKPRGRPPKSRAKEGFTPSGARASATTT